VRHHAWMSETTTADGYTDTVAHMRKDRVKWEKEKVINENKLDRLLDWQH
jgi:hypothetical protein